MKNSKNQHLSQLVTTQKFKSQWEAEQHQM